ncbi:hypothetical protein ACGE32_33640, partial [Klebsiella pneumoniae]
FETNVPGYGVGRDGCRTPMQWDVSANAGFTTGIPWLPLTDDFARRNVAVERDDPRSMLGLYRALIALRRARAELSLGSYAELPTDCADVLAYTRADGGRRMLVAL